MASIETIHNEQRAKAKRWLNRYYFYAQINERMLDLIAAAQSSMLSITAQMEETTTHTAKDALSGQLARLDDLCLSLKDCAGMYGEFLDEITQAIERVGEIDSLTGAVLANRYLCWNRQPDFAEIADKLGYSEIYVKQLHKKGLCMLEDLGIC